MPRTRQSHKRRLRSGHFYSLVNAAARDILLAALTRHDGNRTYAAAELGLQRTYLIRLLRQHKILNVIPGRPGGRRTPTE